MSEIIEYDNETDPGARNDALSNLLLMPWNNLKIEKIERVDDAGIPNIEGTGWKATYE